MATTLLLLKKEAPWFEWEAPFLVNEIDMKLQFLTILFVLFAQSIFSQLSEAETLTARKEHNASLKDTSTTILDSIEYAGFDHLDYFDFDTHYQIRGRFQKKKGRKFKMPTSTERLPVYRRYGYVHFQIDTAAYRLTVYQNVDLSKKEGFEDYLFIPFRDQTSGISTYGGGRYLDALIPRNEEFWIDFNQAYNPYCAYSHHYSCPIPPRENTLNVPVLAGEKIPVAH